MLALKLIRENTDLVREGLRKLNTTAPIDDIIAADDERRPPAAGSRGAQG